MSEDTEKIKDRLDLADLIGEYVPLRKTGSSYKGLCPFHQEKTPSFVVSPDKGIWWCFGCSSGGDAFSFVQKIESMEFPDVLKMLAERTGVELSTKPIAGAGVDERIRLYEMMQLSARFYHEILAHQAAGSKAKEYLYARGVSEQTAADFLIGYAPQAWDTLQKFLKSKGFRTDEMMSAGLVGHSAGGKPYDRFRGRIMFPINDVQGRYVGFGGRITPWHATGSEGKYINSPETRIYEKRKLVYNLQRAKKVLRRQAPCLVVEGYMDVVLLDQIGIKNVVASSGTAFTAEQVELLQRYTDILHFAFDADAAGVAAAESATREALSAGVRVASILFPAGQDPADVALKGRQEVEKYINRPDTITNLLINRLKQTDSGTDRETILAKILPLVQQAANPILQGEMVQELAATLRLPEKVIIDQLARQKIVPAPAQQFATDAGATSRTLTPEQLLLGLVIATPGVRMAALEEVAVESFSNALEARIWTEIMQLAQVGSRFDAMTADEVLAGLSADLLALAEGTRRIAEEHLSTNAKSPVDVLTELLTRLQQKTIDNKLKKLQEKILAMPAAQREKMLTEFQAVAENRARLGNK